MYNYNYNYTISLTYVIFLGDSEGDLWSDKLCGPDAVEGGGKGAGYMDVDIMKIG